MSSSRSISFRAKRTGAIARETPPEFSSGVVERDSNSLALEASLDQVANVESWPEGMLSPASTGVDGDAEKIMNLAGSRPSERSSRRLSQTYCSP